MPDPSGIAGLAPRLSGLTVTAQAGAPAFVRDGDAIRTVTFVLATPKEAAEAVRRASGDDYTAALEFALSGHATRLGPARVRLTVPRPAELGSDTVELIIWRRGRTVVVVELVSAQGFDPSLRRRIVDALSR